MNDDMGRLRLEMHLNTTVHSIVQRIVEAEPDLTGAEVLERVAAADAASRAELRKAEEASDGQD